MTSLARARAPMSVVLALGVALGVRRARADETPRHVVEAGDTCAAIARRYYGDSRLVDLLHRANPDLGSRPPPHSLVPGTVLLVPPLSAPTSGPDAQLTTVRNRVEVLTPETKPGKPNDPLFRGNRVSTQEASAADVTFRDESQVKLGERTLVIILGDSRSAAARVTEQRTTLLTGNLRAWMAGAKPGAVASVGTDAAEVRVFGGEAQVSSDAKRTTRVAVYSGSSTIAAQRKVQEVGRGFGSKAELGKTPTPPRPLPTAPAWVTTPTPVMLDAGEPLTIAGEYDASKGRDRVVEWRVQIARDAAYKEVVADTKAPVETRRFEVRAPGPGHYYVHVSAIDDDGFEGPFGPSAGVLVLGAKLSSAGNKRRLELDPPDAACMRVGNVPLTWVKGPIEAGGHEPIRLRCAPFATDPTTLFTFD